MTPAGLLNFRSKSDRVDVPAPTPCIRVSLLQSYYYGRILLLLLYVYVGCCGWAVVLLLVLVIATTAVLRIAPRLLLLFMLRID